MEKLGMGAGPRRPSTGGGMGGRPFGTPELSSDNIQLMRKLGSGCFGTVWKGTCFQKEVAIKVPVVQELNKKQLANFRKEVEIMSSNPHPNICLFMGACTVPGKFRIVTELMDGNLEDLLHGQEPLSLYERMRMAKDAALGMNWLHRSTPAIIHRDLKTANLLYEKVEKHASRFRVKLCDFGLSEIKPTPKSYLQDGKGGAKGTPLWMPPEVMRGKPFDEKSDVYSFGIVLWEIVTRKDPFPHHDDYDAFIEAVCEKSERPPIPENCPMKLRQLMERCWAGEPAARPDFDEITKALDVVLIHSAITDATGRRFWEENFLHNEEVDSEQFFKCLYRFLKLELPNDLPTKLSSPYLTVTEASALPAGTPVEGGAPASAGTDGEELTLSDEVIKLRCLKELLVVPDKSNHNWVNVERFGQILNWFGPMLSRDNTTFADTIVSILEHEWFHGDIPTSEAHRRLMAHQLAGTFLIRFSNNPSHPGCYTISRVSSSGQIAHIRISHTPGEGFSVNDDYTYPTLTELVRKLSVALDLRYACSGSRYCQLFVPALPLGGYLSVLTSATPLTPGLPPPSGEKKP